MKNNKIEIPAIEFSQNGSSMLVTSMTANELIAFTKVDPYNPALEFDDEDQGYQRTPSQTRIKKLGNFLDTNIKEERSFPMPTAILLSDRGSKSEYDGTSLSFPSNGKFPVIDGQHRIEGIKHAVNNRKNETLGDYSYPCIIMRDMDKINEMKQFKVVNGEAKSVNTALVNMLLTQVAEKEGIEDDNQRWRIIAAKVIKKLNDDPDSVWHDMIIMPNQSKYSASEIKEDPSKKHKRICPATSFMVSLRPLITYGEEILWHNGDIEYSVNNLVEMLNAFWSALAMIIKPAFAVPGEYVIQKTAGIFSLHLLLKRMSSELHRTRQLVSNSENYQRMMDGGHYETLYSEFWIAAKGDGLSTKASSFGSMKGFKELYEIINNDLIDNLPG
tara:strand:- start:618 stop:1775 length:1158 start_codon:yes stop_codon:yes gene_type:complete